MRFMIGVLALRKAIKNLSDFKRNAPKGATHMQLVQGKDKKTHCIYDKITIKNDHHRLYAWSGNEWSFCGFVDKTALRRRIKI